MIRFNPPFSKTVKTDIIGQYKKFFKLINHHFLKRHKMSNEVTITLSYSYKNMVSVIASHNRQVIQWTFTLHKNEAFHYVFHFLCSVNNDGCNYKNKAECTLDNKCLTGNIVYIAVVSPSRKPDKNISV